MREESQKAGKRLLDVLSLHWYPEARDPNGVRICFDGENNTSPEMRYARMQAPRTLWDPTYKTTQKGQITAGENSWINQWYSEYLPILKNIINDINTYYQGTKLAITEFDYGGRNDISGGIALVDVLGIFGKYGVYLATRWGDSGTYAKSAYNIYLNYDGKGSKYGDTCVKAETTDVENLPVYSAIHGESDNKLHIIIINRNLDKVGKVSIVINNASKNYSTSVIYGFDYSSPEIRKMGEVNNIQNNSFQINIPPLTVYHLVLE